MLAADKIQLALDSISALTSEIICDADFDELILPVASMFPLKSNEKKLTTASSTYLMPSLAPEMTVEMNLRGTHTACPTCTILQMSLMSSTTHILSRRLNLLYLQKSVYS